MGKFKVQNYVLSVLLILSLTINTRQTALAEFTIPDAGTYTYDEDNYLYAAADFHIFALESATLGAHTNGNIATGRLYGEASFGTNNFYPDISYIRKIDKINSSSKASTFVAGQDVVVTLADNGNKIALNGYIMGNIPKENFRLDNSGKYIDLEDEFIKLTKLSKSIANLGDTNGYTYNFNDMNNRKIICARDEINIITLNLSELIKNTDLKIQNLYPREGGTVIINVDLRGNSNININSKIELNFNGITLGSRERTDFSESHILWNFYDSSQVDFCYRGEININQLWLGTILAPGATLRNKVNLDGTIIARTFINAGGETHRWDFTGDIPKEVYQAPTPTPMPTITPSVMPTNTPSATPTAMPSITPTEMPSVAPTATPSMAPTSTPSVVPTNTPSVVPTNTPSVTPTDVPSVAPTATPSVAPTSTPSVVPTNTPSVAPTDVPSMAPTATPSVAPTSTPSVVPTNTSSVTPTAMPSVAPTSTPSVAPTNTPSVAPTATPSVAPTSTPSVAPTGMPSVVPTNTPSVVPTNTPSVAPTSTPSVVPTDIPSPTPTNIPTLPPVITPAPTDAPIPTSTEGLTPTPAKTVTTAITTDDISPTPTAGTSSITLEETEETEDVLSETSENVQKTEVVSIPKTGEKADKKIFWLLGTDISLFGIYLFLKKKN